MPFRLSLAFFLLCSTAFGGWTSSGPYGGAVNAVAVVAEHSGVIWAASAAGVFRSTDGGVTWASAGGALVDVVRLVAHPSDPDTAWAVSTSQGLFRTTDGGATWTQGKTNFANTVSPTLLIDPRNPDTLYFGERCEPGFEDIFYPWSGTFKSTDGGATWTWLPIRGDLVSGCALELSIDPFSPWRLFIASAYEPWETYDAAKTWERPQGRRPSLGVVFDRRYPYTHYGISAESSGTSGDPRFLISQDGGFTWSVVATKPPARPRALSIDPVLGRLFLGTDAGVFRSGDSGRVWAKTLAPPADVSALDFGGWPPSLFAATNQGLLRVDNRGMGQAFPIDLHQIATNVISIDVDPSDGTVYAAANDGALRIYRSADRGASWELLPGNDIAADRLTVDGAGTLYATSLAAVYRRRRGELAWTRIRSDRISVLLTDPKHPGTLFTTFGTIMRSRDSGDTWQPLGVSGSVMAIDPSDPRWLYVADELHLYRSSDGGDTWVDLQPGSRDITRGLAVAPSNGNVVYRIGELQGVPRPERSDDRGATWRAGTLPGGFFIQELVADPRDENSIWATADYMFYHASKLFHSTDGGMTWTEVLSPFGTSAAPGLHFDPSGRVLHAVYAHHGVWELTNF